MHINIDGALVTDWSSITANTGGGKSFCSIATRVPGESCRTRWELNKVILCFIT